MKAKRTALLGVLACLVGAAASAQLAPDNGGDIGLFTMPTAWQPEPGHFTLGAYGWLQQLTAGELPEQAIPEQNRVYSQVAFEGSVGLGFTKNWSIFASFGWDQYKSRGGWEGGGINGIPFENPFTVSQGRKLRIGTKVSFFTDPKTDFGVGLWLTSHIPVNNSADVESQNFNGEANINSRRTDWEWGGVITKGVISGMVSYTLSGRHDLDVRPPNQLRFAVGVDVPILPSLHVIGELDYTIQDGGDLPDAQLLDDERRRPLLDRTDRHRGLLGVRREHEPPLEPRQQPGSVGRVHGGHLRGLPAAAAPAGRRASPAAAPPPWRRSRSRRPLRPLPRRRPRRPRRRRPTRSTSTPERPPDQHRQGDARRHRAADEERPELDGRHHRLLGHERQGRR